MSEAETDHTSREPVFHIGVGYIGALLVQISANPCIAVDGKRWSCGARRQIAHRVIQRLIDGGWVAISDEKFGDKEMLDLTEKGGDELILYCMMRSIEIASKAEPPPQYASNGEDLMQSAADVAYGLAERAIETAYRRRGEMAPYDCVTIERDGEQVDLQTVLSATTKPGERYAIMLGLLNGLAEQAMAGLTIGEMDSFAQWCGQMAIVAFARAPANAADGEPPEEM